MKLRISNKMAETYPDLRIGVVIGKNLINSPYNDKIESIKRNVETSIREKYTLDNLTNQPHISAWRETYKSFGVKAKKYNPTCEALVRRVLNEEKIPNINVIVDSYLLAELEVLLPCGGYDLDRIKGDICLRFSDGGEKFHPIGSKNIEETNSGEVIYSDDEKILTRKWNFRDCEIAKITSASKNVALFSEAARKEIATEAIEKHITKLSELLNEFCGGSTVSFIANVNEKLDWDIEL